MNKNDNDRLRKEFSKMILTGKQTQKEVAAILGISRVTANRWAKDIPALKYLRVRANLASELENLSKHPKGNEQLIFSYIEQLDRLDSMIRKAKFIPNL